MPVPPAPVVCPVVIGPVVDGPDEELPPAPGPGSPGLTDPPHASIVRIAGGAESKRMLVMIRESRSEVMADGSFEQAPCPDCRCALRRFDVARKLTGMTG